MADTCENIIFPQLCWRLLKNLESFGSSDFGDTSLADLRGGVKGPPGSKLFQFHAVFGEIWENCMLAPTSRRVGAPISRKSWMRDCTSSLLPMKTPALFRVSRLSKCKCNWCILWSWMTACIRGYCSWIFVTTSKYLCFYVSYLHNIALQILLSHDPVISFNWSKSPQLQEPQGRLM